jgi:voltage-gated potassium channel
MPPTRVSSHQDIDWTNVLAEVPLFADLPTRHVRNIAKLATVRRYEPYTVLVREGAAADTFFLLLDGTAIVRPPGKRPVKLGPGSFFGELALLDNAPRSATVETQEQALVARIGRKEFARLLDKEPKVSVVLLKSLAARLRASEVSPQH